MIYIWVAYCWGKKGCHFCMVQFLDTTYLSGNSGRFKRNIIPTFAFAWHNVLLNFILNKPKSVESG